MRLLVKVLPLPASTSSSLPNWRKSKAEDVGRVDAFVMPVDPQQTFAAVWEEVETRYKKNYLDSVHAQQFVIKKLQNGDGFDIDISDTVGDIFPPDTPAKECLIQVLQANVFREASIPPTSNLRTHTAHRRHLKIARRSSLLRLSESAEPEADEPAPPKVSQEDVLRKSISQTPAVNDANPSRHSTDANGEVLARVSSTTSDSSTGRDAQPAAPLSIPETVTSSPSGKLPGEVQNGIDTARMSVSQPNFSSPKDAASFNENAQSQQKQVGRDLPPSSPGLGDHSAANAVDEMEVDTYASQPSSSRHADSIGASGASRDSTKSESSPLDRRTSTQAVANQAAFASMSRSSMDNRNHRLTSESIAEQAQPSPQTPSDASPAPAQSRRRNDIYDVPTDTEAEIEQRRNLRHQKSTPAVSSPIAPVSESPSLRASKFTPASRVPLFTNGIQPPPNQSGSSRATTIGTQRVPQPPAQVGASQQSERPQAPGFTPVAQSHTRRISSSLQAAASPVGTKIESPVAAPVQSLGVAPAQTAPSPIPPIQSQLQAKEGRQKSVLNKVQDKNARVSKSTKLNPMRWTKEESTLLYRLRSADTSWEEVFKRFPGRTNPSVRKHWSRLHTTGFQPSESESGTESEAERPSQDAQPSVQPQSNGTKIHAASPSVQTRLNSVVPVVVIKRQQNPRGENPISSSTQPQPVATSPESGANCSKDEDTNYSDIDEQTEAAMVECLERVESQTPAPAESARSSADPRVRITNGENAATSGGLTPPPASSAGANRDTSESSRMPPAETTPAVAEKQTPLLNLTGSQYKGKQRVSVQWTALNSPRAERRTAPSVHQSPESVSSPLSTIRSPKSKSEIGVPPKMGSLQSVKTTTKSKAIKFGVLPTSSVSPVSSKAAPPPASAPQPTVPSSSAFSSASSSASESPSEPPQQPGATALSSSTPKSPQNGSRLATEHTVSSLIDRSASEASSSSSGSSTGSPAPKPSTQTNPKVVASDSDSDDTSESSDSDESSLDESLFPKKLPTPTRPREETPSHKEQKPYRHPMLDALKASQVSLENPRYNGRASLSSSQPSASGVGSSKAPKGARVGFSASQPVKWSQFGRRGSPAPSVGQPLHSDDDTTDKESRSSRKSEAPEPEHGNKRKRLSEPLPTKKKARPNNSPVHKSPMHRSPLNKSKSSHKSRTVSKKKARSGPEPPKKLISVGPTSSAVHDGPEAPAVRTAWPMGAFKR
ncbi:hypothetical protein EJ06DRAFT_578360 [Trichodelitschia bisporula]|uniref:Myb-like domain-containing protein n=1 Tax=Trichodelitschia bisporula TaxID=703511 RepID=A0A6G1I9Z3_9PEZI|nr:hypothetical protein EJ06DRAFT_578360 [Trichodelitschia bisporula]